VVGKINKTLIKEIKENEPPSKPYEIVDTTLTGYIARVQPTGRITYIVSYRLGGKRNRITIGQSSDRLTPDLARQKARSILDQVDAGIDPAAEKKRIKNPEPVPEPLKIRTLRSFLDDDYEGWCKAHNDDGEATVKRIRSAFKDILDIPLEEIDELAVDRWRTKRINAGRQPSTINRDMNALKSMFSTALKWKFIESHPLAGFKNLDEAGGVPLIRYLSADEESRLYEALETREKEKQGARARGNAWRLKRGYNLFPEEVADPLYTMITFSLHTGLRRGALFKLEWKDIDFEKSLLTVRAEIEKTKNNRYIPLNSKVLGAAKAWQKRVENKEFPDQLINLVFPNSTGEVYNNVKKSWANIKEQASIRNFRWHDMRHTFASNLVMRGVDLNTVRELMGHSDIKMTLRYAHLAPEHKAAAVAVLV